jgi:hypothetical protein
MRLRAARLAQAAGNEIAPAESQDDGKTS